MGNRIIVFATLLLSALVALPAIAQQTPYIFNVVNSASYGANVAQGSLFVVYGTNFGPAQLVQASSYPLLTQLAGTQISVTFGSTSIACPMVYSMVGAAAAIMPSNVPAGTAMVSLTYNQQTTPFPASVNVVPSAVGMYTLGSSGLGTGIFTGADNLVKTFTATAKTGETVTAWATGLGPVSGPDNLVPPTFPNFPDVEVFVGTQAAKVLYAGRSGCCVALDQISFEIPSGVAGCYVPVAVRSGGVISNFVSIPLSKGGGPCSDAGPAVPVSIMNQASTAQSVQVAALAAGPVSVLRGLGFDVKPYLAQALSKLLRVKVSQDDVAALLLAGQTHNQRELARAMMKYAAAWKALSPSAKKAVRAALSASQEGAVADFGQFNTPGVLAQALGGLFPSQGGCTALPNVPGRSGNGLDAGSSLTVSGPAGAWTLTPSRAGQYQTLFGTTPMGPNLPTGTYTITGAGGHDVTAFSATLNVGASVLWTNKSAINTIDRSQPLTITWSGGPDGGSVVLGGYVNSDRVGLVGFVCTEAASAGSFTIPSFMLSTLPAAATGGGMFISPHPLSRQVTIPGIDLAYFMDGSNDAKSLVYQ